ncbi:MAG: hypothetical protein ACTHK3_12895 [Solirubrobacterales bacterium]
MIAAFGRGVWGFVVGDDWRAAVGVATALALTALLEAAGVVAWWVTPIAAVAILYLSVRRAVPRRASERREADQTAAEQARPLT